VERRTRRRRGSCFTIAGALAAFAGGLCPHYFILHSEPPSSAAASSPI
jgi:hypothetical protein